MQAFSGIEDDSQLCPGCGTLGLRASTRRKLNECADSPLGWQLPSFVRRFFFA
jgi:hypothetical protein